MIKGRLQARSVGERLPGKDGRRHQSGWYDFVNRFCYLLGREKGADASVTT